MSRAQQANKEVLWAVLGFSSMEEFTFWLQGNKFKPFMAELVKNVIIPEQDQAAKEKKRRVRGPDCRTVERRLYAGERGGSAKFSSKHPDKHKWDKVDHYAACLYDIKTENSRSVEGIFYGKDLNEIEITNLTWNTMKHVEHGLTDSRKPRSKRSAAEDDADIKASFAAVCQQFVQLSRPDAASTPPPLPASKSRPDAASAPPPLPASENQDAGTTRTAEDEMVETSSDNEDQDEVIVTGEKVVESEGITIKFEDSNEERMPVLIMDEFKDDYEPYEGDDPSFLGNPEQQYMDNADRMAAENESTFMNLNYRFWVCVLIDTVLKSLHDLKGLQRKVRDTYDMNRMRSAEAILWMRQMEKQLSTDTLYLQPFDEEAASIFDRMQDTLNNTEYQREDTKEACQFLGIPWRGKKTVYRMMGMAVSTCMCFWQPSAVKAIAEFYASKLLRACILADTTGVGKTWEIICWLIYVSPPSSL